MNSSTHQKVSVYVINQLAQAEKRLLAYTVDREGQKLYKREIAVKLEKYIINFTQVGEEPRWVAIPGLRGVGKTTVLAQIFTELKCPPNRKIYISLDEAKKVLGVGLVDIFNVFEEILGSVFENLTEPIYIFIDEVQYEENWGLILKTIYDRSKRIFIFTTGSSALSLQTNPDVSRRIVFEKLYPLSFSEYVMIKHRRPQNPNLSLKLRDILFNSESGMEVFDGLEKVKKEVSEAYSKINRLELDIYLKYGTLPFTLQYVQEPLIYEQIEQTLTNIHTKDIPQLSKFEPTTLSKMNQILFAIASSDITSLRTLADTFKLNTATLSEILLVYEKSEVLLRVYPYGSSFGQVKRPSKYLFLSPAYRSMFFNLIGSTYSYDDYKGKILEDAVGLSLRRLFGLRFGVFLTYDSAEKGADFIVSMNNKDVPIEVGYGSKGFSQVSNTFQKTKAKYGISICPSKFEISMDKNFVAVPLGYFFLI